jgi:hypothetical protein
MYDRATVVAALRLRSEHGSSAQAISVELGVNRATVATWLRGQTPRSLSLDRCNQCGGPGHDRVGLPLEYLYLLGLYLGDGCISAHARGVYRLRIVLDRLYPGIIASAHGHAAPYRRGTGATAASPLPLSPLQQTAAPPRPLSRPHRTAAPRGRRRVRRRNLVRHGELGSAAAGRRGHLRGHMGLVVLLVITPSHSSIPGTTSGQTHYPVQLSSTLVSRS